MEVEFLYVLLTIFFIIGIVELTLFLIIKYVRKNFQWLITSMDEKPELSVDGLKKFFDYGHDSELGWVRKPNTSHNEQGKFGPTMWKVNSRGSRYNPGFDEKESKISCYGDSYTFSRQVNDNETWEHFLSNHQDTNILNFGVGNYGVDQAIIRLKREFPKNKTKVVVLAVVPETITRILSVWKHYYEYGNTFAFKPRFLIKNGDLELIKNIVDIKEKFSKYYEFIDEIKKYDYFYKRKFQKEKLHCPYFITIFKNFRRNFGIIFWVLINSIKSKKADSKWNAMRIIMRRNLQWRVKLYKIDEITNLLRKILEEYALYAKKQNFVPIFIFLPQKDDLLFIKKNYHFFEKFENELRSIQGLNIFNITEELLKESNLDELFSDDNEYGGHLSKLGNNKVAEIIDNQLRKIQKLDI